MTREEAAAILKRSVDEMNDVMAGVTMSEGPKAAIQRYIDAYSMAVDALLEKVEAKDAEEDWICESCVHYPPSSCDGKPCCACDPDDPMLNCYQKKESTDNDSD